MIAFRLGDSVARFRITYRCAGRRRGVALVIAPSPALALKRFFAEHPDVSATDTLTVRPEPSATHFYEVRP